MQQNLITKCNQISFEDLGKTISVRGFVTNVRKLGSLNFCKY